MSARRSRPLQFVFGLTLVVALVLGLAGTAYAADFRSGDVVIIGASEVVDDDLYVAADRIVIDGTIRGDLYAAGREVVVNGTVEGDLLCGAQYITIDGTVGRNVFLGGMSLVIGPEASIGHNVFFGGLALSAGRGSLIGHDVLMAGYQAELDGEVAQDVRGAMGAVELSGIVGRNVNLQMGEQAAGAPTVYQPDIPVRMIQPGLRIADTARIGGSLSYESTVLADISSGAQVQGEVRHSILRRPVRRPPTGPEIAGWIALVWLARLVGTLIALLIVGALVFWLLPTFVQWANGALAARPWASLGWGCLTEIVVFIGVPVAVVVVIALAIIFGVVTLTQLAGAVLGTGLSVVGLFVALFSLVSVYVTKVVVALRVGRAILGRSDESGSERWFWPLLVGVLLFVILRAIPVLGAIISFFVTLFGMGAIVLSLRDRWGRGEPAISADVA